MAYRGQPATLAINLVLAIAENLLQIVNFYVIGRGLGIRVPMLPFFAAIAVTALVRRLAMHVEGKALGEGAAVVMFALLGVQKDAAVALTFAHYALWLLASLPGAYLLFRSGVKFRSWRRARRRERACGALAMRVVWRHRSVMIFVVHNRKSARHVGPVPPPLSRLARHRGTQRRRSRTRFSSAT